MRRLDGITDSMDMSLSKLQKMVKEMEPSQHLSPGPELLVPVCPGPEGLGRVAWLLKTQSPGREAALAWASLAQRSPASSVLAREGASINNSQSLLNSCPLSQ